MLTIRSITEELGLELLSGAAAGDNPIRWVHSSELPDPTPWLSGGELLLTTGLKLDTPVRQRQLVERVAEHGLAGIGFGTGFGHKQVPQAMLDAGMAATLPIFEVPYELPFIAVTKRVMGQLVNEQYDVLQRSLAIHKRLEALVLEEAGLGEILTALADALGGATCVLGPHEVELATGATRRRVPPELLEGVRDRVAAGATAAFQPDGDVTTSPSLALPVTTGGSGPQAWLVAHRRARAFGDFERLLLQQAVTVVALELMRQRTLRDAERRLAGNVLAEALTGGLAPGEVERRLLPFGISDPVAVLVFSAEDTVGAEADLDRFMNAQDVRALVAARDRLLCAVVGASDSDPLELAAAAREQLAQGHGQVYAGVSRPCAPDQLRRAFHEARCALEATRFLNGSRPEVSTYADLGAFQLLLAVQDDEALRAYSNAVLAPLEEDGSSYGDELVRSVEVFIEQNGQWEKAARQLFCHRHTLRYRIRKVEELTGRDLSRAQDRIEFWLALRARELVT